MNVVDSSGWLEYLADDKNANFFAAPLKDLANLLVPTISILEVFKRVLQQRDEDHALQAAALMQQGTIVELTVHIALEAAKLGRDLKLPLADSVMLASARTSKAVFWTQDADFEDIPDVRFIKK